MDELTKVKLTIMMSFDKPNKNGSVFTKEAVEDAVFNLQRNLPIVCEDDRNEDVIANSKVIGATTGESHIATWDFDNQVCKMTIDCVLFNCSPRIVVNEIEDGKISDFRIASIGLTV